ncbi:hypothetical protein N311_10872, partial [Apaloderma vittatum]
MGMNKQGRAEPLMQFRRDPVSSKEISQEEIVVCNPLERSAVQRKSIKLKSTRRSLGSCKLPGKISNPTELRSNKYLLETQLQKTHKDSQQLDSGCDSQSLVLSVITKSSELQDVAKRKKRVTTQYWGLEGFFVVGANPKQGMLEACSSLCTDSSLRDSSILFPEDGKCVTERSLSEYADDSVVQDAVESQLSRSSRGLEIQNRVSPMMAA